MHADERSNSACDLQTVGTDTPLARAAVLRTMMSVVA